MLRGKKTLAIVMARGGSKGLPGKNIKRMNGKPLIEWTIDQIKRSKLVDDLYVSTDSEEIASVCRRCGVDIKELRPDYLAKDDSTSYDVLEYILNEAVDKDSFDYIINLEPTSPLRKEDDIDNIIESAINNPKYDGVISVGEVHTEHPSLLKQISSDNTVQKMFAEIISHPLRQLHNPVYFPYGVGYAIKVDKFLEEKTLYTDRMLPYYIERWQNYEIDDLWDFVCVEAIMRELML